MAHVQKYTKANMQGLSIHLDRKTENHSNEDIDIERSHLNYDLCEKEGDTLSRMNERLDEVYCMDRKDVKACCSWVVTLPENLKDAPDEHQRKFFEETYGFLADRYGGEKNVLSANVHNDETTPHMHFAFIPVVYDPKKEREKVSAKLVINRNELKVFHKDLDVHLKESIPEIYQDGILNDKTIGLDDIESIKKHSKEIEAKKADMSKELEE
ncbi:mob protein, partial [Planomicrobium sp. YIM 101495]|nr:mob protein [Planomicrobium sp. YIM 101495]